MCAFPLSDLSPMTLGTVQIGRTYGKADPTAPPTEEEAQAIFDLAWAGGIACFDTARNYGEAEHRIGAWLARGGKRPLLISKAPPFVGVANDDAPEFLRRNFAKSIATLGVDRLDGYMIHRADDLYLPGVADALRNLVAKGRVGAIGVSVYLPEQLEQALRVRGVELVQAPVSALDQRLTDRGLLDRCREAGVAVFARSIFLQGVFFLEPNRLPAYLAPVRPALDRLKRLAAEVGCSLAALALAAVLRLPGVVTTVVGVNRKEQLRANLKALTEMPGEDVAAEARRVARGVPEQLLDPRRWPGPRAGS